MRSLLEPAPPRGGLRWSPRLRLDEDDIPATRVYVCVRCLCASGYDVRLSVLMCAIRVCVCLCLQEPKNVKTRNIREIDCCVKKTARDARDGGRESARMEYDNFWSNSTRTRRRFRLLDKNHRRRDGLAVFGRTALAK